MSRWAVLLVVLGTLAGCSTLGGLSRPSADDPKPAMPASHQTACDDGAVPRSPYQQVSHSARARHAQPDDPVQASSPLDTASAQPAADAGLPELPPAADAKPVVADLTSDPMGPLPKVRLLTKALRTPEMENPGAASPAAGPETKKAAQADKLPELAKAPAVPPLPDSPSLPRDTEITQAAARAPDAPLPPLPAIDEKVGSVAAATPAQTHELVVVAKADAAPAPAPAKPEPADRPCARFVGGIDAAPPEAETQGSVAKKVQAVHCLSLSAPPADAAGAAKPTPPSIAAAGEPSGHGEVSVSDAPATASGVRFVNSKRFRLNYEVKDVGPSGITGVELWYTQDGRTWHKHDATPHQHSPYVVEVGDEDLYGFTLRVRSGAGMGKEPPRPGDPPQVWVAVDATEPAVRLLAAEPGTGQGAGTITILWAASDKNLTQQPITLSYAEQAAGPWVPIATKLPNTGRYLWQIPPGTPLRFLVRVEAADQAGNVGSDQSPGPLTGDPAQPSVAIVNVEPARK